MDFWVSQAGYSFTIVTSLLFILFSFATYRLSTDTAHDKSEGYNFKDFHRRHSSKY
jgi:hypothetical protein